MKMPKFLVKILMPLMTRLTFTCEMVSQKVSQSMDHPLSSGDRIRVRLHLLGCELCTRYEKQLLAMRKMIELYSDEINYENTDISLSESTRQKIKQEIQRKRSV